MNASIVANSTPKLNPVAISPDLASREAMTLGELRAAEPSTEGEPQPIAPDLELGISQTTDTENGRRLAKLYGDRIRYVAPWGWLVWDKRRWLRDDTDAITRFAKNMAKSIYREAADSVDKHEARKLAAWATTSQSHSKLASAIWCARSEEDLAARVEDFDANPWLLNVKNGVIDLRTGQLLSHDPDLHITKLARVAYDPKAHSDFWIDFLHQIFGENAGMVDFVQRAVGYSLTGDTSEQCLFYCHGKGANGKSTFLETLRALFGDYGQQSTFDTFQERKYTGGPRNDVAGMEGARLVCAIESGEGRKLNETLIKTLTGQDTVRARYLFKENFEFKPQFKVWLAANHDPVIRGTDDAIWRRIRKIPFSVTFSDNKQDKHLAEKLRGELSGVLAWAVRGCLAWQREGLNPPEEVTEATKAYRADMDTFASFLADCCIVKNGISARAADLFAAYQKWGGDETQTAFGTRLREHRFTPDKDTFGARIWCGLGLRAKAE